MSQEFVSDMNQSTVETNLKPGYRLRSAREAKQLSQEQVATQLRLSPFQIEAIEKDDYSYVPASVYARGHISMYARLLGLPLEEILQSFAQLQPEQPPRPLYNTTYFPTERESESIGLERSWVNNGYKMRWLGVGLLMIVVLMATVWWVGRTEGKHQTRNNIVVSPADGSEISQIGDSSVTMPSILATDDDSPSKANKSNHISKNSNTNATQKDQKDNKSPRNEL
ncbi:MAG: helix-turn-helix domain-containing protein [Gammaproteobacteria bacterium]